jgi:hypothetical protein
MPDALELVYVDPKSPARLRRKAPWRAILDEAMGSPPDSEPSDPPLPEQDIPPEDRRDVFLVLARGAASDEAGVAAAFADALRPDGKLVPPLVLAAGELRFAFDELSALRAMVTTATPFLGGDEPLRAAVDAAKELLGTPDLRATPAAIEALDGRIREAFGRVKRAVPAGYLEAQTDRALLEQRCYQQRMVAGAPHLRCLLHGPDGRPMLTYLTAAAAPHLPLFQRFQGRVVGEVLPVTDQFETHPFALRVMVLARVVTPPPARR